MTETRGVIDPRPSVAPGAALAPGVDSALDCTVLLFDNRELRPESGDYDAVSEVLDARLAADVPAVAVMARGPPVTGRIVLEAFRCMGQVEFRLCQAAITPLPSATPVLVSGPAARAAGTNAALGCLGPGSVANATIGRAVVLGPGFLSSLRPRRGRTSACRVPRRSSRSARPRTSTGTRGTGCTSRVSHGVRPSPCCAALRGPGARAQRVRPRQQRSDRSAAGGRRHGIEPGR